MTNKLVEEHERNPAYMDTKIWKQKQTNRFCNTHRKVTGILSLLTILCNSWEHTERKLPFIIMEIQILKPLLWK